ncbi:MAG: hypothetical protein PHN74_00330 [Candidatus Pacebacteria bacterium]|nr:hypothetical protein [Candidatus Paceibacterota bacterium]
MYRLSRKLFWQIIRKSFKETFLEIALFLAILWGSSFIFWLAIRFIFGAKAGFFTVFSWYSALICLAILMRKIYKHTPLEKEQ